jgi:hypothetical protein
MQMGQGVDFNKYNSPEAESHRTPGKYSVGRLVNGNAIYWKQNSQGISAWTDAINDASIFDLPTARGFAVSLRGDVINRANGQQVSPDATSATPVSEAPTLWDVEFVDIAGAHRSHASHGVLLRIETSKCSGFIGLVNFSSKLIRVVPFPAHAQVFTTKQTARAQMETVYTEGFKTELDPVKITATTTAGDILP